MDGKREKGTKLERRTDATQVDSTTRNVFACASVCERVFA